jgi:hypothetical protein
MRSSQGFGSVPVTTIEGAVLDGLGDVRDGQVRLTFQIGDGAGDIEDAIVGAGGESLLLHRALEKLLGVGAKLAEGRESGGFPICALE